MSPEALARLRELAETPAVFFKGSEREMIADLRALLAAYAAMEKERDEALAAGRTVVEAADEMRQQWAEIEEDMTNERDTARAEGVAAERARVVADLRKLANNIKGGFRRSVPEVLDQAAYRYERGDHEEGM